MQNRGITLISLVVTIIVLLILSAISITLVVGPDGLLVKAQESELDSRYSSIIDKVKAREADLTMAFAREETGEHQEDFINRLFAEKLLTPNDRYDEVNFRTIEIGKQKDNSYKYKINIMDATAEGKKIVDAINKLPDADAPGNDHLKNMTLMVETKPYNLNVYFPISNPNGLEINWDATNNPGNFVPYTGANYTYPSVGEYEIQVRGVAQPGTEVGYYANYDNDLFSFGDENIVGIKYWGENGFTKINAFASNLKYEIPLPSKNSFINATEFTTTFAGSHHITKIPPELFINAPNVESFFRTFGRSTAITSIPENLFINNPNVTNFARTFMGCSSITKIPANLFKHNPNVVNFAGVFAGCTNLTSVPSGIFAHNPEFKIATGYYDDGYRGLFYRCDNLKTIPGDLFAHNPKIEDFSYAFRWCENLQNIPENLFDNNPNAKRFDRTFERCESATGNAPRIWEIPGASGSYAFASCSNLDNINEIPHHWKY